MLCLQIDNTIYLLTKRNISEGSLNLFSFCYLLFPKMGCYKSITFDLRQTNIIITNCQVTMWHISSVASREICWTFLTKIYLNTTYYIPNPHMFAVCTSKCVKFTTDSPPWSVDDTCDRFAEVEEVCKKFQS